MAPRWGGLRPEPYDPDARDADGDGIVQEQTAWERPVGTNLVDELGRAITRGSNVGARPRGMRVVDSSGNDVDYTPTYARPGAAPGAERVGGATALADHGAGSLKERGLPSVRAAAAPRVPEPEVAPEQITDAPEPPALRVDGRPKASAQEMAEASRIAKSIQESVEAEFGPLETKQQARDALNRAFPTASGNAEALLNSAEYWDENTERVKAVRNFVIGLLHMSQQDPQTAARITRLTDLDTKDPNAGGVHMTRVDIYSGTFQSWAIAMNPWLNVNSLEPDKREMGEPWAYKMALSMKETGEFSDDEINQILQQSVAIHEFGHAMHMNAGLSHWGSDRGGAIPAEAMIQAFANVKKISVSEASDEINAYIQRMFTKPPSDETIPEAIASLVGRGTEVEQAFVYELYDTIKWDGVDGDEATRAKILEDLSKASEYATTGGKRGQGSQYDEGIAETIAVMVATGTPASGGEETLAHVQSIFPGSAAASADQSKPDTPSVPGPDQPREAAKHLLPRLNQKNEAKLGSFDEDGFGIPQVVPTDSERFPNWTYAVEFIEDGGDLAEVPDEYLYDAIVKASEGGLAYRDRVRGEPRFEKLGDGEGVNGMLLLLDKTTGKKIGLKQFNEKDEDLSEVLGAHFAERFGFANGAMRIGRSLDNPDKRVKRAMVFELIHNYAGEPEYLDNNRTIGTAPLDDLVSGTLLDFVISNSDRHHMNFFIVRDADGNNRFVPIDHSFSLGVGHRFEVGGFSHFTEGASPEVLAEWMKNPWSGERSGLTGSVREYDVDSVAESLQKIVDQLNVDRESKPLRNKVEEVLQLFSDPERNQDPHELAIARFEWLASLDPAGVRDVAEALRASRYADDPGTPDGGGAAAYEDGVW